MKEGCDLLEVSGDRETDTNGKSMGTEKQTPSIHSVSPVSSSEVHRPILCPRRRSRRSFFSVPGGVCCCRLRLSESKYGNRGDSLGRNGSEARMERNIKGKRCNSLVPKALDSRFGAQKTCPLVKIAVILGICVAVYVVIGC